MAEIYFKEESYKVIGACMEVHKILSKGNHAQVYIDALEVEFNLRNIPVVKNKRFTIQYKNVLLPHEYEIHFIAFNVLIVDIRAVEQLTSSHIKQTLNFLAVSKYKLGLLINFGQDSLMHERVVL